MKTPLISIITVTYNAAHFLKAAIESVLSQTYSGIEYIIIDGGSTDGTVDIIKSYESKLAHWISEPDKGIYNAMNKSLNFAKGDFIYFLGADDILSEDDILSKFSKYLTDNKTIYYGNVFFKSQNRVYDGRFNDFKLATRNISHQCIFYPKEVFHHNKFNTKYKVFADYYLNIMLYNNPHYAFEYRPLTIAVFNDAGISGQNSPDSDFERDRLAIIKEHFPWYVYLYRIVRNRLVKMINK